MRLFRYLSISLVAAALITGGCGQREFVLYRINGNSTAGVRVGQLLKLQLEANATTGYIWQIAGPFDEEVLKRIGKYRYVHKSRRIGAGGYQLFRFEGLEQGQTRLRFEYRRPWEEDKPPARTYTVRVLVH